MNSSDLNQLAFAKAEPGKLTLADGRTVEFIDLHLEYLHAGTHHKVPELTMTPDQARNLAMLLLAQADKAQASGRSTGSPTH